MASVDNILRHEGLPPGMEALTCKLTATGTSTLISRVSHVRAVFVSARGTNGATFTWTGRTVTITGTENDDVDIVIFGSK